MSEWKNASIMSLIESGYLVIGDGYRAKNEELSKHGLPFARAGNINNGFRFQDADCLPESDVQRIGNKISKTSDVVFTSKGTVGRFAFVCEETPKFVYSPQLCFWRSENHGIIDPKFLFFWMFGDEFYGQFKGVSGQTDMAEYVSLTDQRRMKITLPPIKEQLKIASVLGALDDKIELNRQMNETLEAMARAIFKDWFVDFGPTRAKMEGRAPYLAPDIWSLFPDRLDDEGKPEGWSIQKVEDILELAYGKSLPSGKRVNGPIPVYGSGGINGYHNEFLVNAPSVIVGRKGTVGSLYWEDRPVFPIDTVFYVKSKLPLTVCFYYLQLMGLNEMNTDAAVPGLNRANVYRLSVTIPTKDVVLAFDKIVSSIRNKIKINIEASISISDTRDFLLPKLMSGEIQVRDAAKILETVA